MEKNENNDAIVILRIGHGINLLKPSSKNMLNLLDSIVI